MKILPVALQASSDEPRSNSAARSDSQSRPSDPVTSTARVETVVPAVHAPSPSDAEQARDEMPAFREIRAPRDPRAARFVMAVQALRIDESEATLITSDRMQQMREAAEAVFQIRNGIPRPSRPTDRVQETDIAPETRSPDTTAGEPAETTDAADAAQTGFVSVDGGDSTADMPDVRGAEPTSTPETPEPPTPPAGDSGGAPADSAPSGSRAGAETAAV